MHYKLSASRFAIALASAILLSGLSLGAFISEKISASEQKSLKDTVTMLARLNKEQGTLLSQMTLEGAFKHLDASVAFTAVSVPPVPPPSAPASIAQMPSLTLVSSAPQSPRPPEKRPPPPAPQAAKASASIKPLAQTPAITASQTAQSAIADKTTPVQAMEALKAQTQAQRPSTGNSAGTLNTPSPTAASVVPSPQPASISMELAGISGIDTSGVTFKSGRYVAMGGEFPSGEKLISVNPVEGRIVTDRRVIILAKPAPQ